MVTVAVLPVSQRMRIVEMLSDGCCNQDIATTLGLAVGTVKWYIAEIMKDNGLYGTADSRKLIAMAAKGQLKIRNY